MRLLMMIPLLFASGCVSVSHEAICTGTRAATADHAAALAVSLDDRAVITGGALIAQLDEGCGR